MMEKTFGGFINSLRRQTDKDFRLFISYHDRPDMKAAGERVVFEAALCGCKCVVNDKVGHSSWERDLTDIEGLREWLRKAPFEFWNRVDEVLLTEKSTESQMAQVQA